MQYLRKILSEKKDLGDKIEGAEIDLAEAIDDEVRRDVHVIQDVIDFSGSLN